MYGKTKRNVSGHFVEIIVNRIEEQFAQDAIVQVNTVVKNQ